MSAAMTNRNLPARYVRAITKHASNMLPDGPCRGIRAGTAGTLNFIDGSGTLISNFPIVEGDNAIEMRAVRTGGTADNLWALY